MKKERKEIRNFETLGDLIYICFSIGVFFFLDLLLKEKGNIIDDDLTSLSF